MMKRMQCVCVMLVILSASASVFAAPTLTNGGFESVPPDLTGWSTLNFGTGAWSAETPGSNTPLSNNTTLATGGSGHGSLYAVTDQQFGTGTYAMFQKFTVGTATNLQVDWDMFVNSSGGPAVGTGLGLDHTGAPVQFARVDILKGTTTDLFTTGSDVLKNVYLGVDNVADPHPFTSYSAYIGDVVAASTDYYLRFAAVTNLGYLNMGVDNVSLQDAPVPVPAPGAMLLAGLGSGLVGFLRRRQWA